MDNPWSSSLGNSAAYMLTVTRCVNGISYETGNRM